MYTSTVIFPWNSNFGTGIAVIDEQHRKLVDLLNNLARNLAFGVDTLELNRVFDELTDYAVYHFKTEEAIWRKYLPADEMSAAHEQVHQDFVTEVLKLKGEQAVLPGAEVVDQIVSFLTHWLAFHILDSDKHMANIVLSLQQGETLQVAKEKASAAMSGATVVLIETVLSMYDSMSSRTLQLMREIAERQRAEERLRLSRSVIDSTLEAVFITDADGLVIDTNPAFCQDVQREHRQIVGTNIRQIKPALFSQKQMEEIWQDAADTGHWAGELLGLNSQGAAEAVWLSLSAVKDRQGVIAHYVGLLSSISQLLKRQHSLEEAAHHDVLTGLPNRRLLHDRLAQAIMRSNRSGRLLVVCYLDLDGFKQVNDTLGHDAGDEVLRIVARQLNQVLRGDDTVARLGGDEFVLLLGDMDSEEDAGLLLNRLLQDIAQPIPIGNTSVLVTASIGVTLYPSDQSTPEQLLKHADEAMYIAKNNGKSRYHVYS
ncbi:MAG: bacteriohemerythrin [Gallionella sp.]|jgi:diguanylate cyclase (GGDEF)-like protein/hemerythrin-like metal-binding protein/PAS domain S-box-containing protein